MSNFKALNTAIELYQECEKLKLKNPIRDQLLRASLSIALNITEGSGRQSLKDQKRFYFIALGSLREVQCIVKIIKNEKLENQYNYLGGLVYGLTRITR